MDRGTLAHRYMNNSIWSQLVKNDDSVIIPPGVGKDFGLTGDGLVTSEGFGETPVIAWNKAMNNFFCSLGSCRYARITMLLPITVKESHIKEYMKSFTFLAKTFGVAVVGGNTQVVEGLSKAAFCVTLIGNAGDFCPDKKKAFAGAEIVAVGYTGILGTNLLCLEKQDELRKRFSEAFLRQASFPEDSLSVKSAVAVLQKETEDKKPLWESCEVLYLHDVSKGGIYGALWQLGQYLGKGVLVENSKIALKQQTIEISEASEENPYLMDGTGSFLCVCRKGRLLAERLREAGLEACVIGALTDGKECRVFVSEKDIRTLTSEDVSGSRF